MDREEWFPGFSFLLHSHSRAFDTRRIIIIRVPFLLSSSVYSTNTISIIYQINPEQEQLNHQPTSNKMFRNFFHPKINPSSITPETAPERKEYPTLGSVENSQVRLGLQKGLFSRTGKPLPIIAACSGSPFHNLQIRGRLFESNDVVLEDATTGKMVAVIVRKYATTGNIFTIYSTHPVYTNQTPAKLYKYDGRLYHFAEIKPCDKVLNVVMEGESDPTYIIHRIAPHPSRQFPTKHVIKRDDKSVASTRYHGEGNSFILTVDQGVDPSLMICLAIIADEVDN